MSVLSILFFGICDYNVVALQGEAWCLKLGKLKDDGVMLDKI